MKKQDKKKMEKKEEKKFYNLMENFKITFSCKKIIAKMYLRNNIKETDFKFSVLPNYPNKEIKIKIKRVKK